MEKVNGTETCETVSYETPEALYNSEWQEILPNYIGRVAPYTIEGQDKPLSIDFEICELFRDMYGEQSDLLVAGRLKWDGCMDCFHIKDPYHFCGFDDFLRFAQIMHWVWEKGQEVLDTWDTCYPIGSFYEDCKEALSLISDDEKSE